MSRVRDPEDTVENNGSIQDAEDAAGLARSTCLVLSGIESNHCMAMEGSTRPASEMDKITRLTLAALKAGRVLEAKCVLVADELRRMDEIEKAEEKARMAS